MSGPETQPPTNEATVATEPDSLENLRAQIDALDRQIVHLLQERAAISLRVGQTKSGADLAPIFVPHREAEVLSNVQSVAGPLDGQAVASIYREILSTSRALQRPTRVAHLGPMATFGHQAAVDRFGSAAELEPCQTHAEVIAMVEKGAADYGLVAFENSTEGPVNEVLDRLVDTPLQICAEVSLPIAHTLLSRATSLKTIKRVLCHPQTAGQTRLWLAEHLPGVAVLPATSNGKAAELAAQDTTGTVAAVGPRIAGEVYRLNVLADNIQDIAGNVTRFLVLARTASEGATGRDKTAVVFSIRDRVGALRDLAEGFATNEVNLSSIQSRPSKRRAWDYVFFVELDGHISEVKVRRALRKAEEHTVFLKVLGSWPVPSE
ncbi:MAG TPA: prephenate dehydratase [Chloroflexota bacterium]|nr:prephenate dehydratase [Chloroflexota bacterium]